MSDENGVTPVAKKPAKKRATSPKKAVESKVDSVIDGKPKAQKDRTSGWPIIWVDAVEGMPNYQEVGVNGNVFRIMREIEVPVPPEVVEVLRNAIGMRIVDVPHPMGGISRKKQQYSTIPWRLVGYVP